MIHFSFILSIYLDSNFFNNLGYDTLKDDYNKSHDFKRKKNSRSNANSLKNKNKNDEDINNNINNKNVDEKKKNKLFKSFLNFFTKISKKLDNLSGLNDEDYDSYNSKNKKESLNNNYNNINNEGNNHYQDSNNSNHNNPDEKFINYLNIRYNKHNNLKNNKKDFNKRKDIHKDNFNKNIKDKKTNSNNFHIKKNKTNRNKDGLVFLKNLKEINNFSENKDENSYNDSSSKQFFSEDDLSDNDDLVDRDNLVDKDYLRDKDDLVDNDYLIYKDNFIKNKDNDEDFENNSDEIILNEKKFNLRDLFKLNKKDFNKIKNRIVTDEDAKTLMGAAIFGLILIVLVSSSYYFFFYQPFQDELATAKIAKLNELNSFYKGPLALDNEAFTLKSQIENAKSSQEIETIDIIRPATESWRFYHNKEINIVKDDFNRVMATYTSNKTKNVIMDIDNAHKMVADNDAMVLANIEFKKPDTVAIPILVTRLQAGAGLISVGTIVDIYTLNSEDIYNQQDSSISENGNESNSNTSDSPSNQNLLDSDNNESSSLYEGPDVSGVTVLAIMRSKESGSIDANYIKTKINVNGTITNQIETTDSFSTDVDEMLRGAIAGGFNEAVIAQLLDKYGLKLSDYERRSNLAELDVQYLLLIEVPRGDVLYVINNMDSLILTIPIEHAPNWMVDELKSAYT